MKRKENERTMAASSTRSKFLVYGLVVLAVVVFGTLATRTANLSAEVERLQEELKKTQAELDGYRYAPERLLAQFDQALEARAVDSARVYLDLLAKYHPHVAQEKKPEERLNALVTKIEAEQKAAEEKRLAEERAAREREARALRAMRKTVDEMKGVTFYYDPNNPRYINQRSGLFYYIAHRPGLSPLLRVRAIYTGSEWVFFRTIFVKVDDEVFRFYVNYFDVERDNDYEGVWEWIDVPADGDWQRLANRLKAGAKNVRIRFEGSQYYRERTMSAADITAVRRVLDAYEYLRRNPDAS